MSRRPDAADPASCASPAPIRLVALGPEHASQILQGQDQALADEVIGTRWEAEALAEFLERVSRWRHDGPLREYAAVGGGGALVGGGGLHLLGAGLEHGQAAMTYWVLSAHRGRNHGAGIASALVELARADSRIVELVLRIAPGNDASAVVARGIGARPTGMGERHPSDARRWVERWVLSVP